VVVNGKKDVKSIKIEPEILSEEIEMVEDMVLGAIKNAMENVDKIAEEKMKSITGGMMPNIPGF
jgi:DNA-binding protein YbaB